MQRAWRVALANSMPDWHIPMKCPLDASLFRCCTTSPLPMVYDVRRPLCDPYMPRISPINVSCPSCAHMNVSMFVPTMCAYVDTNKLNLNFRFMKGVKN